MRLAPATIAVLALLFATSIAFADGYRYGGRSSAGSRFVGRNTVPFGGGYGTGYHRGHYENRTARYHFTRPRVTTGYGFRSVAPRPYGFTRRYNYAPRYRYHDYGRRPYGPRYYGR